jgi:hypothetical protein
LGCSGALRCSQKAGGPARHWTVTVTRGQEISEGKIAEASEVSSRKKPMILTEAPFGQRSLNSGLSSRKNLPAPVLRRIDEHVEQWGQSRSSFLNV